MPRKSAESRAGAAWRAGNKPPAPPRGLSRKAAALWREIVAEQPVDWWRRGNLRLLRRYVRSSVTAEKLHDALDAAEVGSSDAARLLRQVVALNGSLASLAVKLRLTVQSATRPWSGKLSEPGASDDPLLGGKTKWQNRRHLR